MRVDVRHALPRIDTVLDRDVQTRRVEDALDHPAHAARRQEEVRHLGGGEVRDARDAAARADQDVAWEDGFDVDEGEAEGGEVEDLF